MTRAVLVLMLLAAAVPAAAQDDPQVTGYFHDSTRVESWSFFTPFAGGGDPDYTFFGNRATLGVRVEGRRFDVDGAFQYAQLIHLPANSIGPGALGGGALYFFSAQNTEAYQLYFKTIYGRMKNIVPGVSITAGRMGFSSGEEQLSGDAAIDRLTRERVGSRLIGNFEWSAFQRSFDGARVDVDRRAWSATSALLFPTQGGYEESANPTISSLRVITASFAAKPALVPHTQLQAFAYHYRDHRDVRARPDNIVSPAQVDVSIATFGGSAVTVLPGARGDIDAVVWAAAQSGDWYSQDHGALSAVFEGGYRFASEWRPWLRAGFTYASGDANPVDRHHGTFFQMLPSIDRQVETTIYSLMNVRDVYAQLHLEPRSNLRARVEVHRVSLADVADRWYYGSGATSRNGNFFGFSSRASGFTRSLATTMEGKIDATLTRHWSINGFVGFARGGDVVRRLFTGERLVFITLGSELRF